MAKFISIIIPVLNEESTIVDTLQHICQLPGSKEVIVVDGGSEDKTCQLGSGLADKVCQTSKGRGHQMNIGAKEAKGDILFFLHSDSWVEKNALLAISDAMNDPNLVGGSFSLKIDDDSWLLRFISWTSNLRAKFLKLVFGDQGIFVRTSIFDELGGYPEIELMEDWEFSRLLANKGNMKVLPEKIYTSARRWHKFGIWKTIFLMHKIKLLHLLGVKPSKLKDIYQDAR